MKPIEKNSNPKLVRACSIIIGLAASGVASAAPQQGAVSGNSVVPASPNSVRGEEELRSTGQTANGAFSSLARVNTTPILPQFLQTPPNANSGFEQVPDIGPFDENLSSPGVGVQPPIGNAPNSPPVAPAPAAALGGGAILGARLLGRRR